MREQFMVRASDNPAAPLALELTLLAATERAARHAADAPDTIIEVLETATGQICLRVRLERDGRTVLVQRPPASAGDAWPDPPAWRPLEATA